MNDFTEIDARRAEAGVTRRALYERAAISKETWRRTALGKTEPNVKTLRRLRTALDAIIEEKGKGHG